MALDVIIPVFQRNAYFANPENILLSMIIDDSLAIREKAISLIFKARAKKSEDLTDTIRVFKIPIIHINAQHYSELIDWDDDETLLTEPPMLSDLSDVELEKCVNGISLIYQIILAIHKVLRNVKLVTEASEAVYGSENRNGWILNTIAGREKNPCFTTKSNFKV